MKYSYTIGFKLCKVICNVLYFLIYLALTDSTFEPPSEWSGMKDSDNLVVVQVKSGSPEYSSVIDRFHAQVGKKEIVQVKVACLFAVHLGVKLHISLLEENHFTVALAFESKMEKS